MKSYKTKPEDIKNLIIELRKKIADHIEKEEGGDPVRRLLESYGVLCFLSETLFNYLEFLGLDKEDILKIRSSFEDNSKVSANEELLTFSGFMQSSIEKN